MKKASWEKKSFLSRLKLYSLTFIVLKSAIYWIDGSLIYLLLNEIMKKSVFGSCVCFEVNPRLTRNLMEYLKCPELIISKNVLLIKLNIFNKKIWSCNILFLINSTLFYLLNNLSILSGWQYPKKNYSVTLLIKTLESLNLTLTLRNF